MTGGRRLQKRRGRILLCGLIIILSGLWLNGKALATGATRIITDMKGRQVKVPDPLNRIALFGGPTGQIAYILGARDQLCAITNSIKASELVQRMDPSIRDLPAPRTTAGHINIESLILASPQLVIAGDLDGSIVEKKTDIPVAYLESSMSHGFDLLKQEMRFYAKVFHKEDRAERYIEYLDSILGLIHSRVQDIPEHARKVVFNGYSPNHLVTLGGDTFMDQRIQAAGCGNAARGLTTGGKKEGLHVGLDEVSMEKVLVWDPDILVIDFGKPEEVYADPQWQSLKAVKTRQVFLQPVGVFIWDRPTAESAVLYPLWLAKKAYPERFEDINLLNEVKRFYGEIMDFPLTDAEADTLLNAGYGMNYNIRR